jgi:RND family efflux transporter MFP subunit
MKKFSRVTSLLLLISTGCSRHPQTLPDRTPPVAAAIIAVSAATVPSALTFTGVVAAQQAAEISSQILAPIAELRVREGDRVTRGQVLVRLSSAALAAGVQQAESQVAAARQQESAAAAQELLASETFARYQTLDQRHSVTPHEFDQVRTGFAAAQAQRQAAAALVQAAQSAATQSHANQAFTVITAPFAGVVTAKFVDAGAMATPGMPILRIEDVRQHEVDIQVNEAMMAKLRPGALVQVSTSAANPTEAPTNARIREIVPSADPAAHTFLVKIALPASTGLYSGMTANVVVSTANLSAITLPRSSIRERGQLDSVLALDRDSVAQIRYVNLGRQFGDRVEVTSGLTAGDRVLAHPDDALIGRRIEPRP